MDAKVCKTCGEEKGIGQYYKKLNGHQAHCKECRNKEKRRIYQTEKDKVLKRNAEYYKANSKAVMERKKEYRQENLERIQEREKRWRRENRERLTERNRQWRASNTEWSRRCARMYNNTYRARKGKLNACFTPEQWGETKDFFQNQCAYCGKQRDLTQEHFIPVTKGGCYTINNIIPACQPCNSSKQNKDFESWYPEQEYYSKRREKKIFKYLNIEEGKQQLKIEVV